MQMEMEMWRKLLRYSNKTGNKELVAQQDQCACACTELYQISEALISNF